MSKYVDALTAISESGVRFLVVGAFGMNLHGEQLGPTLFTRDCDLMLPPDPVGLAGVIGILRAQGFAIEVGGEPLPDEDDVVLGGIVRHRACVRAIKEDVAFDLPLQIAGGEFEELWSRRRRFRLGEVDLPTAALEDLIRSKQLADRPKDRLFLETFRSEIEDLRRRDAKRNP